MKTLASIFLGLVVLAALLFFLRRPDEGSAAAQDSIPVVAVDAAPNANSPASELGALAESRAEVQADPTSEARVGPVSEPAPVLRGSVVVVDERGHEVSEPSGTFTLSLEVDGEFETRDIEFERGSWGTPFALRDGTRSVAVLDAQVGTRFARVTSPATGVPLPESLELVVRLALPPSPLLRVVDAATGAELSGITLARPSSTSVQATHHPGLDLDKRSVASGLASPIELEPYRSQLSLWDELQVSVGADGYAWTLVTIDLLVGGESRVVLRRGGSLSLDVHGASAATAAARLRLRVADERVPLLELELATRDRFEIDGLPQGDLDVSVELGEVFQHPILLGRTVANIPTGGVVKVRLELVPPPEFLAAKCEGTLWVHGGWASVPPRLILHLLDAPLRGQEPRVEVQARRVASNRPGFDEFRWAAKDLQAGRHLLELETPDMTWLVDLPAEGRRDLEFVVGAPAQLRVRVLDAATGQDLRSAEVAWHARRSVNEVAYSQEPARFDTDLDRYVVRSAPVPIELWTHVDGYAPVHVELDLSTGVTEHTVRLERACAIVLRLKSGEMALTVPHGWHPWISSPSTGGETRLIEFGTSEMRFVVSAPGTYELAPPKLPGYKQPPLRRIEVFAGKDTVHVVEYELERP